MATPCQWNKQSGGHCMMTRYKRLLRPALFARGEGWD